MWRSPHCPLRPAGPACLPHCAATKLATPITAQLMLVLPPLETAVVQGMLVLLTWNPAGYCATSVRPGLSLAGRCGKEACSAPHFSVPVPKAAVGALALILHPNLACTPPAAPRR